MRILFVDEDMQTDALIRVLSSRFPNDTFDVAYNLGDGKQRIWESKFDLLVIDIMMPADDAIVPGSSRDAGAVAGLQLVQLLEKDPQCPNVNTPVVILTGVPRDLHPMIKDAQTRFGPRFLRKPVQPGAFYDILKATISEGKK